MKNEELPYCGRILHEYDPDRFLLSMLMPVQMREALWALGAFNYEIAKTREIVSDTTIGLIRLQWWRDGLKAIYEDGKVPEAEIIGELADIIKVHKLPHELFESLIFAREFDLEDVLPATLDGMLNYAVYVTEPLNKISLLLSSEEVDLQADEKALKDVSAGYALTGLLRAAVSHAQQRRCYLPQDLLDKYDVRLSSIYDLKPDDGLAAVVKDVHELATTSLSAARPVHPYLKAQKQLAEIYLKQLKNNDFNVFSSAQLMPPAFMHLRLLWGLKINNS